MLQWVHRISEATSVIIDDDVVRYTVDVYYPLGSHRSFLLFRF